MLSLKSILSGALATFGFLLMFESLKSINGFIGFIAKYPIYIFFGAAALIIFRDKILEKIGIGG